jgi:hypothetical protein
MRVLAWLVILAAAGIVGWLIRRRRLDEDPCLRRKDVDIKVSSTTDPPLQEPNVVRDLCRNARIHFLVTNNSRDTVTVRLVNFKKKSSGEGRRPVKFDDDRDSVTVPPGHRLTLKAKVRVDPDAGEDMTAFKYDIRIDGGAVNDPELEIRRPRRFAPPSG